MAKPKADARVLRKIATKINVQPELIQDVYPCTDLQASLLAADLHGLGSYVSTFVFDLSSSEWKQKDVMNACEELYDRSPILRTRCFESKGKFLQVVTGTPLKWQKYNDLNEYLESDHDDQVKLGGPLSKFAWISNAGQVHMVWSLHHALYDEWSINLLFNDLSALVSSSELATQSKTRPKFSRFIKALDQIDPSASKLYWQTSLKDVGHYSGILSNINHDFQTSDNVEFSRDIDFSQSNHQPATLMIAAWSIFIASLTASEATVFGNIVNGRTADVPDIVDICGPTMTTVPYALNVPVDKTVGEYLRMLEEMRNAMLPFEQTGLDEYRQTTGTGRFDTLLSIRSSQSETTEVESSPKFRPSTVQAHQVRHPCLVYLDAIFESKSLAFKASFDVRYIRAEKLSKALERLTECIMSLTKSPDTNLSTLMDSIQMLDLIRAQSHSSLNDTTSDTRPATDPAIMERVRKCAYAVKPRDDLDSVSPETSLGELGLDSLSMVVLARKLSEAFKISVPVRNVTGLRTTISEVALSVQNIIRGSDVDKISELDLMGQAEQHLKHLRNMEPVTKMNERPACVLLTGASGYVGIAILQRLLTKTDDRIVLMVRCKSDAEGLDRIRQVATIARWKEDELGLLDHRVQIWPSDLQATDLGLNEEQVNQFKDIRTVIHNGARVDFSLDYHDLERTNVSATATLLRRHLESVSTPSFVYLTGGRSCPLKHEESLEMTASKLAGANGYAQSKFVSEVLVQNSQDLCTQNKKEARMTIIHPGIVIGSESTGVANTDDFIWRYVAASIQMGAYVPAVPTKREWINLMTVDQVASETVSAAMKTDHTDKTNYRLMRSGLSVVKFWDVLRETLGPKYKLVPVSEWEWLQRFEADLSERGAKQPLFSLSPLLFQGLLKGVGGSGPRPEGEPSHEEIVASERAVAANISYLEAVGFFSRDEGDKLEVEVFGRSKR